MLRRKFNTVVVAAVLGMAVGGAARIATAHEASEHAGKAVKSGDAAESAICPVSGEKIEGKELAQAYKYEYKGKTYYLCCADCLSKFKENPEKYIRTVIGK